MTFPLVSADPGPEQRKELLKKIKEKASQKLDDEIVLIQRMHPTSCKWICNSCSWTGDRFFMEIHPCKHNIKNNFEKVAQRLEYENERYR
jgi:hypothetical protein